MKFINKIYPKLIKYVAVLTVIIFVIGLYFPANASENNNTTDSLIKILPAASIKQKQDIYLQLSNIYNYSNFDSAIFYGNLGLNLALLNKLDRNILFEQLTILSKIYSSKGLYNLTWDVLQNVKEVAVTENNYELLISVEMEIASYYVSQQEYGNAIATLNDAIALVDKHNLFYYKSSVYRRFASLYIIVNDYPLAYNFIKKALNASYKYNNKIDYVNSLLLKSSLFFKQAKYDSSYIYGIKAIKIAKTTKSKDLLRSAYRSVAMSLMEKKEFDAALLTIDSSLALAIQLSSLAQITSMVTYKAHLYSLKYNVDSVLSYVDSTLFYNLKALDLRLKMDNKSMISSSYINIGGNYTVMEKYDSAFYYINKGLYIAREINLYDYLVYGYGKLTKLYSAQNKYDSALYYAKIKIQYSDTIYKSKTNEEVLFNKSIYELEKENKRNEIAKSGYMTIIIWALSVLFAILVFFIIILARYYFNRKKSLVEVSKLSKIIETTKQAVVLFNKYGIISYVNKGFEDYTGYHKDDVVNESIFNFTDADGRKIYGEKIIPLIKGQGSWEGEMNIKKKDGSFFISNQICSTFNSSKKNITLYVSIFNDITIRKEQEQELKNINNSLSSTLVTRDKMFSIIAHDLTGPFSSILGFSKLMATEFNDYNTSDHIKFSQFIYESGRNTFDLLTNLLHWSRSQLGSVELFTEEIDLLDLINENVDPLKLMLNKKEITLLLNVQNGIAVLADNNTMGVVIRNLFSNAIKFTPRLGTIEISAKKNEGKIAVAFIDSGVGMSNSVVANLFNKNKNNSEKGTEDEKGTGLGLHLCKEFIELNKGTISVESELGSGTIFTITIPSA